MAKENLIKLTNNLYSLTLLFPKKEPLRYKIRELADGILANSVLFFSENPKTKNYKKSTIVEILEQDLEVLDSFFEVAKAQNWVSSAEILKAQQEYSKVKEDLKKLSEAKNLSEIEPSKDLSALPGDLPERQISLRQEKILEILKEREKLQVKDLKEIFPQVSKRTLRRDFENLLKQGAVERIGERNETFYVIKK